MTNYVAMVIPVNQKLNVVPARTEKNGAILPILNLVRPEHGKTSLVPFQMNLPCSPALKRGRVHLPVRPVMKSLVIPVWLSRITAPRTATSDAPETQGKCRIV